VLDEDELGALAALAEKHGPLPATRESTTGRGRHLWFRTTPLPIPNSAGRVGVGIDVRGEGGYVVVPPSLHPDGPAYHWVNADPIAEAPSWLLMLAKKPPPPQAPPPRSSSPRPSCGRSGAYGAAALRAEIQILANAPKGYRNHQANKSAFSSFQLVAGGEISAAEAERALIEACIANGLWAEDGERQCLATIRSGARAGMQHPRSREGGAA
jgi:hypothetical protein